MKSQENWRFPGIITTLWLDIMDRLKKLSFNPCLRINFIDQNSSTYRTLVLFRSRKANIGSQTSQIGWKSKFESQLSTASVQNTLKKN